MSRLVSRLITFASVASSISVSLAQAATIPGANGVRDTVQKTTESQIHRLIDPLLEKYCREQCKLLGVSVQVDVNVPESTAPGFDDLPTMGSDALAPTGAKLKILMGDRLGSVSRGKLIELIQRYLDTLDYPVTIDTETVHFPDLAGSDGKIAEMRERISKDFENTVNSLIQQFCPEQCLFTDFSLKTDVVNSEEAQYASAGEIVQEGDLALKIREIGGTLLIDETLSAEEQGNVLEMIKLKTSSYRNVAMKSKTLKFPRPIRHRGIENDDLLMDAGGQLALSGKTGRSLASERSSKNETNTNSKNLNSSTDSRQISDTQNRKSSDELKSSSTANSNTSNNTSENDVKKERFEHYEKIERVENGDAVQAELQKFKVYALIFGCSILSLLIFIAIASMRQKMTVVGANAPQARRFGGIANHESGADSDSDGMNDSAANLSRRLEAQRLTDELLEAFSQNPRVAKHVFTRVITEEGIEVTALYLHIFGESIVLDLLRDASLQGDMNELMEYYARTAIVLKDSDKLELLRKLHQRTVAGKMSVIGNRSSNVFDFLGEMDSVQILEMIRNESLTVKAVILTQCDSQKRSAIYSQLDEDTRMKLLTELSRIDYLPRDYVFNVGNALKRKCRENPRLNTEALPGSEVLVNLLERTGTGLQRDVMRNLEASSPESARNIKGKLVSIETLRYLRDGQLLEVVLSLRHDELLQFLKAAAPAVREAIFAKSPRELVVELEEELASTPPVNRETYSTIERKILNRMKLMANDGLINLVETNERMFAEQNSADITGSLQASTGTTSIVGVRREAG